MSSKPALVRSLSSALKATPSSPSKGILKRAPPPPLALNKSKPPGFSITVVQSPSPRSPHVHFPPSASLTATFHVHSPNSYDRAPIKVSPNPLELPAWGDRIYSPSIGSCKKAGTVDYKNINSVSPLSSPVVSVPPEKEVTLLVPPKAKTRAGARFKERVEAQLQNVHPNNGKELGKALSQYPRSPYPTASFEFEKEEDIPEEKSSVQRNATVYGDSPIRVSRKKERMALSPIHASPSTPLNEAFWKSVSLEGSELQLQFGTQEGEIWEGRSKEMSPAPKDPSAAFPSFTAVLSLDEGITYPPPVALPDES